MDKQTGMSVLLPHPVVTIGIIKEIDVLGIEPGEPDEGFAGGVDFLDQSDGLGGLGGLDGIWIFGERGFVDAFDDVIDPFEFLRLLSEFAPVAAGRPRIHLLNQLVRRDPHFLCNGSAKANPPTLAFLMKFALLGEVELGHDHRADLVVKDDSIRISVRFLSECGDGGGGHGRGERFHNDVDRRIARFHGFENPITCHDGAAGRGVDDDKNG